jgi:hypothetical protein
MTRYRVTSFFKTLLSSDGHRFKCPQGAIEIICARSPDRAVQAAQHRFERLRQMPEWTLFRFHSRSPAADLSFDFRLLNIDDVQSFVLLGTCPEVRIVVQHHVQQGIVDLQGPIVLDESELAELVHEHAHA